MVFDTALGNTMYVQLFITVPMPFLNKSSDGDLWKTLCITRVMRSTQLFWLHTEKCKAAYSAWRNCHNIGFRKSTEVSKAGMTNKHSNSPRKRYTVLIAEATPTRSFQNKLEKQKKTTPAQVGQTHIHKTQKVKAIYRCSCLWSYWCKSGVCSIDRSRPKAMPCHGSDHNNYYLQTQ